MKLQQENERLMEYCEKYQDESEVHAEGEAKANMEVERLTRLLHRKSLETQVIRKEASEWRKKHDDVLHTYVFFFLSIVSSLWNVTFS